ncbi:MAG TPA: methyltransferase domain-containing protein [Thermoanaerobaculia bacterium]|nr:methyltransferase domain-containing protein [Thermoanaerobaculia bacterium]
MRTAEFDHPTRGRFYSHANEELPSVRANEFSATTREIGPRAGDAVLELGCGNGLLTGRLAAGVGERGAVHAIDVSHSVLLRLKKGIASNNVIPALFDGQNLPFGDGCFDAAVSLANFHHVAAKLAILREVHRVLRAGGRFVLVDVCADTPVQRYFDGPVNSFCSTGHNHPFLGRDDCARLCDQSGLRLARWRMQEVPWRFQSCDEAQWFLHKIHDAQCSPAHCLSEARRHLAFGRDQDGMWSLEWQLFFLTAVKP